MDLILFVLKDNLKKLIQGDDFKSPSLRFKHLGI
jgi:hypothetical protein